jgi:protein required for attachment to host cells
MSDRQGLRFSSVGSSHSTMGPETGHRRQQKCAFANHLAEMLAKQLQAGAYHCLIIAASPVTLGDLRKPTSDRVRATVVAEISHDLTNIAIHQIAGHLKPRPVCD